MKSKTMDPQNQQPQQYVSQPSSHPPQMPAQQQQQASLPELPGASPYSEPVQSLTPAPQYGDQPQYSERPAVAAPDNGAMVSQITEAINGGKNVLVTVSVDPSVDELASAVGMTFLLGKLGKSATAVFSGKIPPAMEFLRPEEIFEDSVDSLRDFIIALDKEKADKLRYKVEEDVVKIFITPYKTVLSEKDFEYSQGDFNVDVVIALGVTRREDLDKAITAHGRILHDATVVTVNTGELLSGIGSINWRDPEASSVAEMMVMLGDELGKDKFDSQISTAFLTGLVAQTNRFSNDKTSPKVMTTAAQLMAAGADQQLVATNLRHEGMISEPVRIKEDDEPHDDGGEMVLDHSKTKKSKQFDIGSNAKSSEAEAQSDKSLNKKNQSQKTEQNTTLSSDSKNQPPVVSTVKSGNPEEVAAISPPETAAQSLRDTLAESAPEEAQSAKVDQSSTQVVPDSAPLTLPPPVEES